jgi:glycosyltransferase involved in cell wall biosynthesis
MDLRKKKILIITLSDLRHDARVRRQIEWLKNTYDVTIAAFSAASTADYKAIDLKPINLSLVRKSIASVFLLSHQYRFAHKLLYGYSGQIVSAASNETYDLVIANDVETLPIAFSLKGNHKVMFDAHEYAPRHFEDKLTWRIFFQKFNIWLCKTYLHRLSSMSTVGKALALEYEKHFNVKPTVITNANIYHDLQPSIVESGKFRLVHVGIANRSRRLDLMVKMMDLLDDAYSLDLFLLTPGFASAKTRSFIDGLKSSVTGNARVRILPPIPSKDIVTTLNNYDIGVFLLPPVNFNYKNTLPNKLFDFIQARLGIAIGPTPEMAEIVKTYDNGVVSTAFTPESLADELKKLTKADVIKFKTNSARAAKDFNAENNGKIFLRIIKETLN